MKYQLATNTEIAERKVFNKLISVEPRTFMGGSVMFNPFEGVRGDNGSYWC